MQISSASRRPRPGEAGANGSPRWSSISGGAWRRQASSKRRTRDSNSSSVIAESIGQQFTDPGERATHRTLRAAGVLGDLRDRQSLQPEFQDAPVDAVEE